MVHTALSGGRYLFQGIEQGRPIPERFELVDPDSRELLLVGRRLPGSPLSRLSRRLFTDGLDGFDLDLEAPTGERVLRVRRRSSITKRRLEVLDESSARVGAYRCRPAALGGGLDVLDLHGDTIGTLRSVWSTGELRFLADLEELARFARAKPDSADEDADTSNDYLLKISDKVPSDAPVRPLLFGAIACLELARGQ